jgi:[protein-PII] uridylyltransferase
LVSLRNNWERGETEIFIFTPGDDLLFERTTALLGQLGVSIVDARIINTPSGYALSTYQLLDEDGNPIEAGYHSDEVVARLREGLKDPQAGIRPVTRQAPRHFRHFRIPTDVSFEPDEPNQRTILQLITADRPGLLSVVARVFTECGVILQNARISTFGVRAEDVFYITDRRRQPLRDKHQFDCLQEQLKRQLDA